MLDARVKKKWASTKIPGGYNFFVITFLKISHFIDSCETDVSNITKYPGRKAPLWGLIYNSKIVNKTIFTTSYKWNI